MDSWLLEPFEPEFMQRALIAGMLAVVASSVVGTWVVLRGLSFLGDALAHGVIPGMALAVLWGFNLTVGALLTAAVMVAGISFVNRRSRLGEDTGVGLLFVGMLALGVIIISKSRSFTTDVQSLLFGDVLGVTWADVRLQAAAAALVVLCSVLGYRAFLVLSFNEAKAGSLGLRPGVDPRGAARARRRRHRLVVPGGGHPPRVRSARRSAGHRRAPGASGLGVHGRRRGARLAGRGRGTGRELPPRHGRGRHHGGRRRWPSSSWC